MNKTHCMPLIVSFLLENGVNSTLRDDHDHLCWDYAGQSLHFESIQHMIPEDVLKTINTSDLYHSNSAYPTLQLPSTTVFEYKTFWNSPIDIAMSNLKKMEQLINTIEKDGSNNNSDLQTLKKKLEKAITTLQPISSDLPFKDKIYGSSTFDSIYEDFNLSSNKTRRVIKEGRLLYYKGMNSKNTMLCYYFLFDDVFISWDYNKLVSKLKGEPTDNYQPNVFPLSNVLVYSVPNGFGLSNALQLVYNEKLFGEIRKSLTILLPDEDDKNEFYSIVKSTLAYTSQFHLVSPHVDPKEIINEGYLIQKDNILNRYHRVFVRLTENVLYFYDNIHSKEISGKVDLQLHNLRLGAEASTLALQWANNETKLCFTYYCLSQSDFLKWASATRDKKTIGTFGRHRQMIERDVDPSAYNSSNTNASTQPLNSFKASTNLKELNRIFVTITINSGRCLAPKDSNGKSDPYCVIGLSDPGKRFLFNNNKKTSCVKKTLQPVWKYNNTFEFEPLLGGKQYGIRVECWDKDKTSSDDFMGVLILDHSLFRVGRTSDAWYKLNTWDKYPKEAVSGELNITISTFVKFENGPHHSNSN